MKIIKTMFRNEQTRSDEESESNRSIRCDSLFIWWREVGLKKKKNIAKKSNKTMTTTQQKYNPQTI